MQVSELLALFSSFVLTAVLIHLTDFAEKNLDHMEKRHTKNPQKQEEGQHQSFL
jgi:hypothetical protein